MKSYFIHLVILILFPLLLNAQWISQSTGFKERRGLWDISIVDENTVWAVAYDGDKGILYSVPDFTRTINGGATWQPDYFTFSEIYWSSISAISSETAWVGIHGSSGGGKIFKTTDGGINWNEQAPDSIFNQNGSWMAFVYFWNKDEGIAVGDPNPNEFEIYTTINGGNTWTPVAGNSIPDPLSNEYTNYRYNTIGNDIWFSTSANRIFHSADKGLTWSVSDTRIPVTDLSSNYIDVAFWNDKEGFVRYFNYKTRTTLSAAKTDDGGVSWHPVTINGPLLGSLNSGITYIPGTKSTLISTGTKFGKPSGSSYSNDGGTNWILIDTLGHYFTKFLNPTTGWSADLSENETTGGISKFSGNLVNVKNSKSKKEISIGIYPNPSNGHIIVHLNNGEDADLKISVSDLNGKSIYFKSFDEPGEFFMRGLDLTSLSKGEYVLKIENGPLVHSEKFIIK